MEKYLQYCWWEALNYLSTSSNRSTNMACSTVRVFITVTRRYFDKGVSCLLFVRANINCSEVMLQFQPRYFSTQRLVASSSSNISSNASVVLTRQHYSWYEPTFRKMFTFDWKKKQKNKSNIFICFCTSDHRPVEDMIEEIKSGNNLCFGSGKLRELCKMLPDEVEVFIFIFIFYYIYQLGCLLYSFYCLTNSLAIGHYTKTCFYFLHLIFYLGHFMNHTLA